MRVKDQYNFDLPQYAGLRDPARAVTDAMLRAMRFMDTCKESVLIEEGMPMTAQRIHDQAHTYGEMWDAFGDILHQRHLIQEFPATPELDERPDLNRAFEIVISCMDDIGDALGAFIRAAQDAALFSLALDAEELKMQNSRAYTKWLMAAQMWEQTSDRVGYDKWAGDFLEGADS